MNCDLSTRRMLTHREHLHRPPDDSEVVGGSGRPPEPPNISPVHPAVIWNEAAPKANVGLGGKIMRRGFTARF